MKWIICICVVLAISYMAFVFALAIQSSLAEQPVAVSKQRHLGACTNCHTVRRPTQGCGQLIGLEWEKCVDRANGGDRFENQFNH